MKIHQHFIRHFIIVFTVAILCVSFISYLALESFYEKSLQNDLKSTINVVKLQINNSKKNLQTLADDLKKATDARVTFISDKGVVLGESDFNLSKMENHNYRPEIQMAEEQNFGMDIRYSKTLKDDFLYVANEFSYNGKTIFLRLSIDIDDIQKSFFSLWLNIILILIFIIAFIASFVFSYFTSKKMKNEIDKLSISLQNIANKDYKTKITSSFAKEFVDISNLIDELAQKLAKRDKQKRKNVAKLKLINKQRYENLSAISHEFKNPIATIMGYASTLLEEKNSKQDIKERFLNKIYSNAKKMTLMIDRLALSVKLENNDLIPNFAKFDLGILADEVIESFKARFPNRNFKVDISPTTVKADSMIMEIILNNLLDNALKYSQKEICITVKDKECIIQDFGEGIAKEEIEKVSKKFYRSNRLSWDNSMGLGLFLVSYMLKMHNSKLQIKSQISKGSTFSFKLE